MDLLSAHRSRRPRAAASPDDRATPLRPRARLRALAIAVAGLLCTTALLAALLSPAAAASSLSSIPASALTNDLKLGNTDSSQGLLSPVVAPPAILGAAGTLPSATEPAAYAAGSVAVSIIFPQSKGASSSESWTTTDSYGPLGLTSTAYPNLRPRQVYIVGEIQKALDWWAAQAPAAAQLRFVIPAYGTLGFPRQRGVAREPIKVASTNDQLWRHPIMNPILRKLGLPIASAADSPPPETAYDNAVRKANHTDWAFTVYVVDSLHDDAATTHDKTPGEFPNGAFAYTFALFGPYSVLTYDNATFSPADFDGVLAHEIGHVFGALDEYAAPAGYPSSGSLYSGYLWVRNSNAVQGGTTDDACIMRGGQAGLTAYQQSGSLADAGICPSSRGQIGWRVTRNGLPDVVDTTPTVTVKAPVSVASSTLTIAGSAREVAWPPGHNAKGRAFAKGISIFVPHDLRYSVDGGVTTPVNAAGSGATRTFSFPLDTSGLGAGPYAGAPTRHLIAVQATTGTTATKSVVAWGASTPVTLTLKSARATVALGGKATLTMHAADADDVLQTTYPIGHLTGVSVGRQGAATSRKSVTTGAAGNAVVTFTPSFTTTYEATFTPGPRSLEFLTAASAPVTVAVRARLTASAAAPTPARVVRVAGTFRPHRAGVALALQALHGGVWTTVARTHTTARATFRFAYAAPVGTLHLRVRFAGDAHNAAAVGALPAVAVP